jgi:hypothetical protein
MVPQPERVAIINAAIHSFMSNLPLLMSNKVAQQTPLWWE